MLLAFQYIIITIMDLDSVNIIIAKLRNAKLFDLLIFFPFGMQKLRPIVLIETTLFMIFANFREENKKRG